MARVPKTGPTPETSGSGGSVVVTDGDSPHTVIERTFSASTVWTVDHALPHRPSVEVLDAAGRELLAQVEHPTSTRVTVTHNSPTSGSLRLD